MIAMLACAGLGGWSGKTMRRPLNDIAENRELGDVTTLTGHTVMDLIQQKPPAAGAEE